MFESLSDRLGKIFDGLRGRGALSEADVDEALREVRRALLEADVSLEVVKAFVEQVRERAVGAEVTRSVTPGQQVVKIVHDELVRVLGDTAVPIDFNAPAPVGILMVGLQGAGKTTMAGKIAKRLKEKQGKKVLLASLDDRRPAAKEQLRVLGEQIGVDSLPIVANENPGRHRPAARCARQGSAATTSSSSIPPAAPVVDEELMAETAAVKAAVEPARNPARRRRPHRPGRGQPRPRLRPARRYHRHHPHPRRRRWPRRRRALDARRDRQADQADRHRRKDGCDRGFPSRPHRRPHPRHGRHRLAWSRRPPSTSTPPTPRRWRRSSRRASSTSTISAPSFSR